jgi:hypothetical protein
MQIETAYTIINYELITNFEFRITNSTGGFAPQNEVACARRDREPQHTLTVKWAHHAFRRKLCS